MLRLKKNQLKGRTFHFMVFSILLSVCLCFIGLRRCSNCRHWPWGHGDLRSWEGSTWRARWRRHSHWRRHRHGQRRQSHTWFHYVIWPHLRAWLELPRQVQVHLWVHPEDHMNLDAHKLNPKIEQLKIKLFAWEMNTVQCRQKAFQGFLDSLHEISTRIVCQTKASRGEKMVDLL